MPWAGMFRCALFFEKLWRKDQLMYGKGPKTGGT